MSALTSNILEEDIEAISSHRLIWLSSRFISTDRGKVDLTKWENSLNNSDRKGEKTQMSVAAAAKKSTMHRPQHSHSQNPTTFQSIKHKM